MSTKDGPARSVACACCVDSLTSLTLHGLNCCSVDMSWFVGCAKLEFVTVTNSSEVRNAHRVQLAARKANRSMTLHIKSSNVVDVDLLQPQGLVISHVPMPNPANIKKTKKTTKGRIRTSEGNDIEHVDEEFVDTCRVCKECFNCTGWGAMCIMHRGKDRRSDGGKPCGCKTGDGGCADCGRCWLCCKC